MAADFDPSENTASQDDLVQNCIPLGWRDKCSKLLIPLNKCRQATLYAPWQCADERHTYERCQYDDMMNRMKQAQKAIMKKAAEAAGE